MSNFKKADAKKDSKDFEKACRYLLSQIKTGKITNYSKLTNYKNKAAKKFGIESTPRNSDIIKYATKSDLKNFKHLLTKKPSKGLSGVTVVAVMTSPHKCPGNCIYCPTGFDVEAPKSYTGFEPAARRARQFNFDPYLQVTNRLSQYIETNKPADKIELIIMGGTFLSQPQKFQDNFMLQCINAITQKNAKNLSTAKKYAETSQNRISGITFETRPDFCYKTHINNMLNFGGTRVELGVQNPDDEIYKRIKRAHTVKHVTNATQYLKDSAFKVAYHIMPGLPFSDRTTDLKNFKMLFNDERFQPDMLKLYPCLIMEGTELCEMYKKKEFKPLTNSQSASLIAEFKKHIPKYVRIMRIQRDIPANLIAAGTKASNLRQLVSAKMKEKNVKCNCIRCREAGLKSHLDKINPENIEITTMKYNASKGKEIFIAAEDLKKDILVGFCRLRIPYKPFRKEITSKTALIRELHVYSGVVPVGNKPALSEFQHRGFGKELLAKAEEISVDEFDMKKMVVISGLGVKKYYHALGFKNTGVYVSKTLK
ncbi:MAG: tRNA uridine(34) 5-carboxymethylaminomethyl modification radical SAM/GNAT enzyme Elp3 [Candidatus Diapherotrites archaeon]